MEPPVRDGRSGRTWPSNWSTMTASIVPVLDLIVASRCVDCGSKNLIGSASNDMFDIVGFATIGQLVNLGSDLKA